VYYHHDLRLRHIGYCDAEGEHESEQNFFHNLSMPPGKSNYRATMTTPRSPCITKVREQMHQVSPRCVGLSDWQACRLGCCCGWLLRMLFYPVPLTRPLVYLTM
jgi:hypothetical protein